MALTPEQIAKIRGAAFNQNTVSGSAFDKPNPNTRTAQLATPQTTQAPAKASAAPTAGRQNIFTGLCEALNEHQQVLIKNKQRTVADNYVIQFTEHMGSATVKRPGFQDNTTAPMQNNDTVANKLDQDTQSINRSAKAWQVKSGTQIVQLIDQVMRNSSYVTGQQIVQIDPTPDPVTGLQKQTPSPGTGLGITGWYKITVAVEPLGYDTIIRDHAYKMKFIISPYPIAQMASQYFPDSRYRGVHKSYQYWFTGNNTQILHFEQQYNNLYRLTLTGQGTDFQKDKKTDYRDQWRKIYMATSENHAHGAKDYANEPGDNAASFLYDPYSFANVKLRIVGDPGWMQQGECGLGVTASAFNFSPFNPDGGINYDSQAIMFDLSFNQPTDYDFNSGIMNVNGHNSKSGLPQEHYTYTATHCKNIFTKGRFEQEIQGKLLIEFNKVDTQATNARPAPAAKTTAPTSRASTTRITSVGEIEYDQMGNPTGRTLDSPDPGPVQPPTPQPAAPPGAPTSSGGVSGASILNGPPPPPITILPTTPILNPNTTGTGQTLVAQPGANTPPQKMNREY